MSKTRVSLRVSEEITNGTDVADTYIVPDGEIATVNLFTGEAPSSSNASVRLIWDYGGGGEVSEWSIQTDEKMPHRPSFTGDGIKKLAVCCDNACTGDYFMAGYAEIEVE